MRNLLLSFLLVLTTFLSSSQQPQLSETAEISILTVGPGSALNDAFGHNAIRVRDTRFDYCFDYGRFDFDEPGFYTNFAKGKLNYWLGVAPTDRFIAVYKYQNRWVKEQVLDLSQEEKQAIYEYLTWNAKPENKFYSYDFFFDNCSTRPRDIVQESLDNSVTFKHPENFEPQTFRELIYRHVNKNSWGSFGIDLALGSVIDKEATSEQHMFLPIYVYKFFDVAERSDGNGLVKATNEINDIKTSNLSSNFLTSPLMLFGLLGLIILYITYRDYKKEVRTKWLDVVLFTITGLIGIVLLLLWFATDHTATAFNYNILWAFALNVFVIAQVFKSKPKLWFRKYIKLLIILMCLLLLHWVIGVQVFAISLIPILIALFLRYLYLMKYYKLQETV